MEIKNVDKIRELEKRQAELEDIIASKNMKPFKMPNRAKKAIKDGTKLPDSIVTQYLTQKGEVRFRICKIVSGNIIVINNKAHELDPECLWRMGKQMWYIHREIDRKPVSNKDYEKLKEQGRDTESDVVLIKAVLGAINKPKQEIKKGWIIFAIIALVVGLVAYMFLKGGGTEEVSTAETAVPAIASLFIPKWRKKNAT